jgi:hypothetical protein
LRSVSVFILEGHNTHMYSTALPFQCLSHMMSPTVITNGAPNAAKKPSRASGARVSPSMSKNWRGTLLPSCTQEEFIRTGNCCIQEAFVLMILVLKEDSSRQGKKNTQFYRKAKSDFPRNCRLYPFLRKNIFLMIPLWMDTWTSFYSFRS